MEVSTLLSAESLHRLVTNNTMSNSVPTALEPGTLGPRLFMISGPCYSQLFVRQQSLMAAATEEKVLASNRAAFHNYHISTKYEAGAALTGTEVKSVLGGRIQLKDSYVAIQEGEAWLLNAHISPYSHGNRANHDPLRIRKLLFVGNKYAFSGWSVEHLL